jgi:hypothetical protein
MGAGPAAADRGVWTPGRVRVRHLDRLLGCSVHSQQPPRITDVVLIVPPRVAAARTQMFV